MYTMKADGVVFYNPAADDTALHVLSPIAEFEVNTAGTLQFTLLPGNVAYDSMKLLKTIVTLEQDGEVIFRGRVAEIKTDIYNQKEVYCEGTLSFLQDSAVRPYQYSGSASGLLNQLVAQHNGQVETNKQFTVGSITAANEETIPQFSSEACSDTLTEIMSMLVDRFGGYLRIRYSGGTNYLDYIDSYSEASGQAIEFGVNLIDLEDLYESTDVFSVLMPIGGYSAETVEPAEDSDETETTVKTNLTTIASVNGGSDYIEDAAAIAKYGRIVKVHKWESVTDPAELLEKGNEYIAKKKKNARTLTFTALDLHIINTSADSIRLGDSVRLVSSPHGISLTDICSAISLDIEAPHNSVYIFGLPPQTLTDFSTETAKQAAYDKNQTQGQMSKWIKETDTKFTISRAYYDELNGKFNTVSIELDAQKATIDLKATQEEVNDVSWRLSQAEILIDGANAAIELKADQAIVDDMATRLSSAEIKIDGANAAIELKAEKSEVTELSKRLSQAEIDIDGANAQINLKASQTVVDELGERVSSAEIAIDGVKSEIALKADTILLEGYVKADALETEVLKVMEEAWASEMDIQSLVAASINTNTLSADSITADELSVGGHSLGTHSHKVSVNADGTITLGEVSSTGGSFKIADTAYYKEGVSAAKESVTLSAAGWEGGYNVITASNGKSVTVTLPDFSTSGGDTWSSNKTTVYFYTGSVNGPLASKTVDATSVYNSGYNSGYSSGRSGVTLSAGGWQGGNNVVSASNGKSVTVSLPSFSTSGGDSFTSNRTTVYFYTGSVSGPLASKEVDATSIYEAGYAAGAAEAETAYDEGYAAGVAAAKSDVTITGGITSISNTASNTFYASGRVYVHVLGEQVENQYISHSQYINVGQ